MPSPDDTIPLLLLEPSVETQRLGENESGGVLVAPPLLGNIFVQGSKWRMFLRMRDRDVALGHGDFL